MPPESEVDIPTSNVINLSATILTQGQINLLSKVLNFVLAASMDLLQTIEDVNKFV